MTPTQTISIINRSHHPLPNYQTQGAAGMDLYAYLREPLLLKPMERGLVPTGIHIALPTGFEAQIRPRSGLASKGIIIPNAPGTIDADYRGELKILVLNLSTLPFLIEDGLRIAQLVVATYTRVAWQPMDSLESTARGEQGFGSTGLRNEP